MEYKYWRMVMRRNYEDALEHADALEDIDRTYNDSCTNEDCIGTIRRQRDTGRQVGLCPDCGTHEEDDDFRNDRTKELDFND